jgi:putative heme-binding domain-containing protein
LSSVPFDSLDFPASPFSITHCQESNPMHFAAPGRRSAFGSLAVVAMTLSLLVPPRASAAEAKLALKKGDHICLIGNTLADRMQHDGWLEAYLQTRFPQFDLTIRNLGFSADELNTRPRNQNFGDADKHLKHSKADVIFAFFGYNESFAGEAGLPQFKQQLAQFIDHTAAAKYNGTSAPRLVLFSPIAQENLNSPHLPNGKEANERLAMYAKAMAEVAAEKNVPFVDLFAPTAKLYGSAKQPLTFNGVHLTDDGNRQLAEVIDTALFDSPVTRAESQLGKLREAILEKNLRWFNRYRVTDGYNVYGGRSGTGNYDGQTNFTISQRELEIVDVQVANRDKRIWSIAKGGDMEVDDSNAPKPLTIKTNKPGPNPDGSHKFLSGEDAIGEMTVHKGMKINLFADEKMFPELRNPVQSSVDADGRLWVAVWPSYPHWHPNEEFTDAILILEDTDGDGVADRCKTFADKLHNPTGFEFWGGGILVGQAPDIMFLKDTDGDDVADVRERVMHGIDSADTHHTANAFVVGPDGWLYFQSGIFQVFGIESPWHKPFRHQGTGVYRFNPLSYKSEHYFNVGPNTHGDVFDRYGNQFCTDGTSGQGFHIGFPYRGTPKQLFVKQYRPVPGIGLLQGSHFPEELRGNLLIPNCIGFQGVAQYEFNNTGATFHADPVEPIMFSKDPNFRPTYVRIGGDGALYITDWQNPIIGHLQHNLRDPNRDHKHGRVYRVTVDGRPLRKPVKMRGMSIDEVVAQLTSTEDDLRYRARLELTGRDHAQVTAAASKAAASLDAAKPENAQTLLEMLWVHSMLGEVNEPLLRKVLTSPDGNVRAAAARIIREWHGKLNEPGKLLVQLAGDQDARVRAEAVVAATYITGAEAAEVIFTAEQFPKDLQLEFNLSEARKSINVDQVLKDAVAKNLPLSNAAQIYMLRSASAAELMKLKPTEAIYLAILSRASATAEQLKYAISGLAKERKSDELKLIVDLIAEQDAKSESGALAGAGELLLSQPGDALRGVRDQLVKFAQQGQSPLARRIGYAAWISADGGGEDAFAAASAKAESLQDLLEAVSLVKDNAVRSGLYAQIRPLLAELPLAIGGVSGGDGLGQPGLAFEYYLPSASDVAIETLERLTPKATGVAPGVTYDLPEVTQRDGFAMKFSGTLSIMQPGKYTFHLTSDDGSRLYLDGQQLIDNDGLHGDVEKSAGVELSPGGHAIVVTYFDNGGGDALSLAWSGPGIQGKQPLPADRLSTGAGATLYDVAVAAAAAVPGHDAAKFKDLAAMVRDGRARASAVGILKTIDKQHWDKREVRPLVDSLVAYLSRIPAKYRTSPAAAEATELTKLLASVLPAAQAKAVEARLENLDVRVIAIGTVPERMIYDKERIVVEAGRPVELRFSNADKMPHNLVLLQQGALEEVGLLAEATAQTPDVMQRQYVPKSDKIIFASNLLQPEESQAISFEAPKVPGVYPYVCTYPGHWRRMHGALVVVENLAEYDADPATYLTKHELPIKDELLKLIGKDREWKAEEFLEFVKPFDGARSYEVGYNAFKVSSCIACHKIGSDGIEIGPDLTKLEAAKKAPEAILASLLMPSDKIDEKYVSQTIVLTSGKIVTGMVLEETPDAITIIENPLAKTKPLKIAKDEIDEQTKSAKSIMPEGLLSKLTREEVLDLIAFIHAGGDKKHTVFAGHDHGAHEGHNH